MNLKDYLKAGETVISNLILENYQKLQLSDDEFLFWLQLYRLQSKGDLFPDLASISQVMGKSLETIYELLNQLVTRGFILIETQKNEYGQTIDTYNLLPIFQKIEQLKKEETKKQHQVTQEQEVSQLYQMFEKEFGRPLSPIELEMIGQWLSIDQYKPEIIHLALREAVLNQAYSLKYIDRILLAWENKNLTTKEQVATDQKRRKQLLMQKEVSEQKVLDEPLPTFELHNWLEPEDK